SKEYMEFKWIPVSSIIKTIAQDPIGKEELTVQLDDGSQYTLMEDLSLMLRQKPVLAQLKKLGKTNSLNAPLPKHTWSASNCIGDAPYSITKTQNRRNIMLGKKKIFDEYRAPKNPDRLLTKKIIADQKDKVKKSAADTLPLVQKPSLLQRDAYKLEHLDETIKKAVLDAAFQDPKENPFAPGSLSPTQAYLKLMLGNEYFVGDSRDVLKKNLTTFAKVIIPVMSMELGREFSVDEEVLQKLVDLLEFEVKEHRQQHVVMYHGLDGSLLSLYQYFSSLHALLKGEKIAPFGSLRGMHIPFINKKTNAPYNNILEVLDVLGNGGDYGKERNTVLLCVNPLMLLGPGKFSHTTSSSIEYFLNSHSVFPPPVSDLMMETLLMLEMLGDLTQRCYEEWHSLYTQFHEFNGEKKNGGLLAISLPQDLIRTHTMLTHGGGSPHVGSRISECSDESITPSILQMVLNLQRKAAEMAPNRSNILSLNGNEQSTIRNLTNEARLYIDPKQPLKIEGKWHYDLDPHSMWLFQQRWEAMIETHLNRLLDARVLPIENTLITPSPNKSVWSNSTIHYHFPMPSEDQLSSFIGNGRDVAINFYLNMFPDLLNSNSERIRQAFWKAIALNGKYEIIEVLDKYLQKRNPLSSSQDLMSTENKRLLAFFISANLSSIQCEKGSLEAAKIITRFLGDNLTTDQKVKAAFEFLRRSKDNLISKSDLQEFGLNEDILWDAFLKNIRDTKDFCSDATKIFNGLTGVGLSLDPADPKGKACLRSFIELWLNGDIGPNSEIYWSEVVLRMIRKYDIDVKNCLLYNDKALLHKINKCFGFDWSIKTLTQKKEYISREKSSQKYVELPEKSDDILNRILEEYKLILAEKELTRETEEYILKQFCETNFFYFSNSTISLNQVRDYLSEKRGHPYDEILMQSCFGKLKRFLRYSNLNPWIKNFKNKV
ncbi:MAG: hypothetical protein LBB29_02375, partial [Holosporaceae bacterium]|nr:hypothetical protein [Holosporaceae bacterium]